MNSKLLCLLVLAASLSSNLLAIASSQPPMAACCSDSVDHIEHPGSSQSKFASGDRDIWMRIRRQLILPREISRSSIRKALNEKVQHLPSLFSAMERSRPYLHYVVQQVEERHLPIELALLPFIESKFDTRATSIYNASGLWQFMPATAKHFDITNNWWYDGRRDIIVATDKALDYFEVLIRYFEGDWLLAIAAYNAGPARIQGYLDDAKVQGLPNYWTLGLPRDTTRYIPSLLAIAEIIRWGKVNERPLPIISNDEQLRTVHLAGQSDLLLMAQLSEISIEKFFELNSGMLQWATPPQGPHRILLPVKNAEIFNHAYSQLTEEQRIVDWHSYKIRDGDTIENIADLFNTPVSVIRQLNSIVGNDTIRAGHYLLVPLDDKPVVDSRGGVHQYKSNGREAVTEIARQYGVSVAQLLEDNPAIASANSKIPAGVSIFLNLGPAIPDESIAPRVVHYRIRAGDTLSSIASRLGTTVDDLMALNDLSSSILFPGKTITIPLALEPN